LLLTGVEPHIFNGLNFQFVRFISSTNKTETSGLMSLIQNLSWSPWVPFTASAKCFRKVLVGGSGIYRVRVIGTSHLAYIGQTGRDLVERTRVLTLNTLRTADQPPWNDPHTAAPGLWAWRIENNFQFEVSVAHTDLPTPERQCLEDALLYKYRLKFGQSTLCNHGRFHPLWTRPSNKRQAQLMERLPVQMPNPASGLSLPPATLTGSAGEEDWLGLKWAPPVLLSSQNIAAPKAPGVYLLLDGKQVVYLGESKALSGRLVAHRRTFQGHDLSCSWVRIVGALPHHLKERETDLIGAFFCQHERAPKFQYKNERPTAFGSS
jgi:hypothetical protein